MEVKVYANELALHKAIDKVALRINKSGNEVQGMAVSCVLMACDSGNTNSAAYLINKLATADPRKSALNRPALIKWLSLHGVTIRFDKATKLFKAKINADTIEAVRSAVKADREAATNELLNKHFTALDSTSTEFSGFDLPARLRSMLKQIEKVTADPTKSSNPKNNFNGLAALRQVVAALPAAPAKA